MPRPLSATMTSPAIPAVRRAVVAFTTHVSIVSASLRHGITTETSHEEDSLERAGAVMCR